MPIHYLSTNINNAIKIKITESSICLRLLYLPLSNAISMSAV